MPLASDEVLCQVSDAYKSRLRSYGSILLELIMMEYSQSELRRIWNKGVIVPSYPSDKVRKDACGAWIIWSEYGKRDSPFGWEIDHIYPEALYKLHNATDGGINNIINLRPLHWKNNQKKGSNYPTYQASVKAEGDRNVDYIRTFEVNSEIQNQLKDLLNL